jgi:hypothetical protein
MLKFNDEAVVGLPVYLLIVIIVACIIFGVFAYSIVKMHNDAQSDIVRAEIEKITSEAENMFEYANEGSLVTVHVNFPDSMSFLVFGSLPKTGLLKPTNLALGEDTSNCYYLVMEDGTIETHSSNARFSGKNIDEIALLGPGSYDLRIELERAGDISYVKIYQG